MSYCISTEISVYNFLTVFTDASLSKSKFISPRVFMLKIRSCSKSIWPSLFLLPLTEKGCKQYSDRVLVSKIIKTTGFEPRPFSSYFKNYLAWTVFATLAWGSRSPAVSICFEVFLNRLEGAAGTTCPSRFRSILFLISRSVSGLKFIYRYMYNCKSIIVYIVKIKFVFFMVTNWNKIW